MYGRADGHLRPTLLGQLGGGGLIIITEMIFMVLSSWQSVVCSVFLRNCNAIDGRDSHARLFCCSLTGNEHKRGIVYQS